MKLFIFKQYQRKVNKLRTKLKNKKLMSSAKFALILWLIINRSVEKSKNQPDTIQMFYRLRWLVRITRWKDKDNYVVSFDNDKLCRFWPIFVIEKKQGNRVYLSINGERLQVIRI